MPNQLKIPTSEEIRLQLIRKVEELVECALHDRSPFAGFEEARALLESLPLGSDEFCAASNRLMNALRYILSDEPGAARFELILLSRSLTDDGRNRVIRRRFKRRQRSGASSNCT